MILQKRTLSLLPLLASLLLVALLAATTHAKDTWTAVRSKHFNLVGNASEEDIKKVATRMEQFRDVFSRLLPGLRLASAVPTTVIVFKSDGSYKPFKPVADGKTVDVAGYFQSGQDVNYITLSTEVRSEDPYRVIFHEYVHLLVNNTMGRAAVPAWFNEGLAEYYSTFDIDDARKVYLGKPITNHILLLRDAKPLQLKTLFSVDHYSLERNKHDTRSIFYAQSWALVHYLIQGNEGKRLANFGKFLDLLVNNTPVETAFRDAFQMDYATLEKELRNYVQERSFRMNIATFQKKLEFDTEMTAAPITEAEAQAYLGDLLYHTNRADEAIAKLEGALALDPDLSMARSSLGLALTRKKDFAKAKEHLAKAAEGDSTNYLAHYYYAFVLSREGMDERDFVSGYSNETAALMRSELAKAIQLKPDFPESYHLMAFVNLVMNEKLDDALSMINKAVALSPGSEEYLFVLSQIYARQQNFAAARKIIERLAGSSSDPTIRATAENHLNSIKNAQEQMARFEQQRAERASHRQSQPPPTTVEPTTVEQNPFAYLEDALRKPGSDEKRMQGFLTSIECSAKGIVLLVEADGRVWRFGAKDFEGIDVTTFTPDVNGELKCGIRKAREWVVVTFKPATGTKAKDDGTPVGLEFVPNDFKLRGN